MPGLGQGIMGELVLLHFVQDKFTVWAIFGAEIVTLRNHYVL